MIRVLVVDDQPMVRAGFAAIIDAETDLSVVGTAHDGVQAVAAARELRPDVILMDIRMPEMDGLTATWSRLDCPMRRSPCGWAWQQAR